MGWLMLVQIVQIDNSIFPPMVRCELTDAHGRMHAFVEKEPVVTTGVIH